MDCFIIADWLFSLLPTLADSLGDLVMPLAQATDAAGAASEELQKKIAEDEQSGISWRQYGVLGIALAVMILPFFLGNFIAKTFKMPTYGTRFGVILLAIIASVAVLVIRRPKQGVDLRGGTILVYEIKQIEFSEEDADKRQRVVSSDLIEPLTRRINPSGTQEIVIRPYGESQIEIIVPEVDQREVERIEKIIRQAGVLQFAILANGRKHQGQIEIARTQSQSKNSNIRTRTEVYEGERQCGMWVTVDREESDDRKIKPFRVSMGDAICREPESGKIFEFPRNVGGDPYEQSKWVLEQGWDRIETLMVVNPDLIVRGEDLSFAASVFDQKGAPAVSFNLTDAGSGKFFALTTNNAPDGTFQSQLGIILDNSLLSAPNVLGPIRSQGQITGNFTRDEVDGLVRILKAGQLPAALNDEPIAKNAIDATLGADTIKKGVYAIITSLALVLIFILFYYRFAGVVACVALVLNLAMIMATMVLINQPLTLPGLAGLVLTVGMSVDANVLIFERIREELKKGAADRMAVRNGFAKATVTIVDANLTTLITAIVLYAIGTDQIRGFAVTLILGILFSMFTAIYMSRTMFDFAERHGFLSLGMSDTVNSMRHKFTGEGNFDFIGMGKLTLGLSAVLCVVGVLSLFTRGGGILDIDFAGGSSVQFRVNTPTDSQTVRDLVGTTMVNEQGESVQYTLNKVTMGGQDNTVFKVDSGFESVNELQAAVISAFKNDPNIDLVTYNVKVGGADIADQSSLFSSDNGSQLVAFYPQDEQTPDTTPVPPAADGTPAQDTAPAPDTTPAQDTTPAPDTTPAADGTPAADVTPAADGTAAPATGDSTDATPAESDIPTIGGAELWNTTIQLGIDGDETGAKITSGALADVIDEVAKSIDIPLSTTAIRFSPEGEKAGNWTPKSSIPFSKWNVSIPVSSSDGEKLMNEVGKTLSSDPIWISSNSVGGRVAGDMIGRALGALFASLLCIIGYIWFRFQRVIYGLAAVVALLHDVLITLGAIAISFWLAPIFGFLLLDQFKISLTVVAALLTIIGYSLNDTIVVFDRIRETKGKAPKLTGEMVNVSINQTLSRTLLTSITTLIVVVLLYAFGGDGIHAFAFALVIGVLAGTYSSVFVASPILLWLLDREDNKKLNKKTAAA